MFECWLSPIISFHHIGYPRYYRDLLESVTHLTWMARGKGGPYLLDGARERWAPMPPYHGVWANGRPCRPVCSATRPAVCSATAGPDRMIERAPRCMRRSGSPEWITAVDRFGVCTAVERPGVCAAVCAPRWRPAVCAPCVCAAVRARGGIGESKSFLLQVMVKSLYYKHFFQNHRSNPSKP